MAITGPWVGSSAVAETGQRWMSTAASQVRLGLPFWMSQLVGRSREVVIDLAANHNYNKDWLIGWMRQQGNAPVVINVRGDMVSYDATVPLFEFPGDLANEYVQLNIHGVTIFGRGGYGVGGTTGWVFAAQQGGPCIHNWIGGRLRINNGGAIAGGGGGGGGQGWESSGVSAGGGGGRPFGIYGRSASGAGVTAYGTDASISSPGTGSRYESSRRSVTGGTGGDVAAGGNPAFGNFESGWRWGPAGGGAAVAGTAPTWQNVGTIYGSRV